MTLGLVERFERKLESTVEDAFARVFGGAIVPEEVEDLLRREAADEVRTLRGGHRLAPNEYVITLSVPDHEKVLADPDLTSDTFAKHLAGYIGDQGWQTYGDVVVRFEQSPALHTGQVRARGVVNPDVTAAATPSTQEPAPRPSQQALTAEPGAPAMSDNPTYRGGQDRPGQDRPGDEYYDDRYARPQEDPRGQDPRARPRAKTPAPRTPAAQDPRGPGPPGPGPPQPGSPLQLRPRRLFAAGRSELPATSALPGPGWLPAVAGAARVRAAVRWLRPGLPPGTGRIRPAPGRLRLRPTAAAASQRLRPPGLPRSGRLRAAGLQRPAVVRPAGLRPRAGPGLRVRRAVARLRLRPAAPAGRLRRPGRVPAHRRCRGHASAG